MHFLLDDRAGLPAAHMLERRDGRTDMYHIGGERGEIVVVILLVSFSFFFVSTVGSYGCCILCST